MGLSARKPKDLIAPAPEAGSRATGIQGELTLHSPGQLHDPLANGRLILEERSATQPSQSSGRSTKLQRAIDGLGDILSNPPEGDDVGFMMSIFANCHLPRVQTKERSYAHRGGDFGILMTAGAATDPATGEVVEQPLPFGGKSRIFLAYINTQAVKTDCRDIFMGDNISDCIHRMTDQRVTGGDRGNLIRWKRQLMALSTSNMSIEDFRETSLGKSYAQRKFNIIDEFRLWLPDRAGSEKYLFSNVLRLNNDYFSRLKHQGAVPIDRRVLLALSERTLAQDIYLWLAYRLFSLDKSLGLQWNTLKKQFGPQYATVRQFKYEFTIALKLAHAYYGDAKLDVTKDKLILHPSPPAVRRRLHRVL